MSLPVFEFDVKMWGCVCVLMLCEWCVMVSGGRGALTAVECITSGCHCTGRCTATSHRHHPEEELLSSRRSSRHFEPPDTGPPHCTTAASLQHLGQGLQSGVQWNTAARHFISFVSECEQRLRSSWKFWTEPRLKRRARRRAPRLGLKVLSFKEKIKMQMLTFEEYFNKQKWLLYKITNLLILCILIFYCDIFIRLNKNFESRVQTNSDWPIIQYIVNKFPHFIPSTFQI